MPRYDYRCEANGHVFEVTQSYSDDPIAFCPEDGSQAERQFTVPHVIYKGSGFYTTDYKNKGNNSSGSSKSSSSGSSSESDSKKSKSDSGDSSKSSSTSSSEKKSSGESKS